MERVWNETRKLFEKEYLVLVEKFNKIRKVLHFVEKENIRIRTREHVLETENATKAKFLNVEAVHYTQLVAEKEGINKELAMYINREKEPIDMKRIIEANCLL